MFVSTKDNMFKYIMLIVCVLMFVLFCVSIAKCDGIIEYARLKEEKYTYLIVKSSDGVPVLARLDEEGQIELLGIYDVLEISLYKPGEILLLQRKDPGVSLYVIDMEDASYVDDLTSDVLRQEPGFGIAYDRVNDIIYYSVLGEVYAQDSKGHIEKKGILPIVETYMFAKATIQGSVYSVATSAGVYTCDFLSEDEILTIAEGDSPFSWKLFTEQALQNAFIKEYPKAKVKIVEMDEYSDKLIASLMYNENGADIYLVNAKTATLMIEKGYCLPLDDIEVISSRYQALYLCIQSAIMYGDKVMAWPHYTRLQVWSKIEDVWDEHLGDMPVPTTVDAWLTILESWDSGEHSGVVPLAGQIEPLWRAFTKCYIRQYEKEGQPLVFNTLIYKDMLRRILALDEIDDRRYQQTAAAITYSTPDVEDEISQFPEGGHLSVPFCPPVFEEGDEPNIALDMSVYVIPVNAPHPDLAKAYLAAMAENTNLCAPILHAKLYDDIDFGVRPQIYSAVMAEVKNEIQDLEKQMKQAEDESERKDLEDKLLARKAYLTDREQNWWAVSEKSLMRYRCMMNHASVLTESHFDLSFKGELLDTVYRLLERCVSGESDIDTMCLELDKRIEMEFMEQMM